jgi:hypothetical protein
MNVVSDHQKESSNSFVLSVSAASQPIIAFFLTGPQ